MGKRRIAEGYARDKERPLVDFVTHCGRTDCFFAWICVPLNLLRRIAAMGWFTDEELPRLEELAAKQCGVAKDDLRY